MIQPQLFDSELGQLLRDEGIRKAGEHANPTWKEMALLAVKRTCQAESFFTTDVVWARVQAEYRTHERRAMGAVMQDAQKRHWCRPRDTWQLSERPECHRRPVRVWESLLKGK